MSNQKNGDGEKRLPKFTRISSRALVMINSFFIMSLTLFYLYRRGIISEREFWLGPKEPSVLLLVLVPLFASVFIFLLEYLKKSNNFLILNDAERRLEDEDEVLRKKNEQEVSSLRPNYNFKNDIYHSLRKRLTKAIEHLDSKANVNLVIGLLITILAIVILASSLFLYPSNSDANINLTILLPRITLAIAIEIFAFFFLKLYRSNLLEIKYYQNELTNIDLKQMALIISDENSDLELNKEMANALMITERNRILEKGQSLLELEKYKIDNSSTLSMDKQLVKLLATIHK